MSDDSTATAAKPRKKPGPKPVAKGGKAKPGPKAKGPGRAATTATGAAPEAVPLSCLDLTVARAVRAGTDAEAVERYKARYAAKEPMPPIECTGTRGRPDTPVWVGDGAKRATALSELGRTAADCLVWWCDTPEEAEQKAWEIAYGSNTAHGCPRTSEDLRAAIRSALLREPAKSSDRAIAAKLHCHRTPVVKVRYEMTEAGELEGEARFDAREYKESEYAAWKLGKAKRPEPKPATAPEPAATPPAARPPETESGWRGVSVLDADLGAACERECEGLGVRTLGQLSDLLDDPAGMGKVLEAHRTDLQEVVDAAKADGLVTADTPVPPPVDLPGRAATPTPAPAPGPEAVCDEKGRPVPEALRAAFAARTSIRSLVQRFSALLKEAEEVAAGPGGGAVQVQGVRQDCHSLTRGLSGGMPYVVCPACDGAGTRAGKACPECVAAAGDKAGRGWVARLRYDQLDPALQAKCESFTTPAE